jgi:hypothetical protein
MRQAIEYGPGHEGCRDDTAEEVSGNAAASKQTTSHLCTSLLRATKGHRHDERPLGIGPDQFSAVDAHRSGPMAGGVHCALHEDRG